MGARFQLHDDHLVGIHSSQCNSDKIGYILRLDPRAFVEHTLLHIEMADYHSAASLPFHAESEV